MTKKEAYLIGRYCNCQHSRNLVQKVQNELDVPDSYLYALGRKYNMEVKVISAFRVTRMRLLAKREECHLINFWHKKSKFKAEFYTMTRADKKKFLKLLNLAENCHEAYRFAFGASAISPYDGEYLKVDEIRLGNFIWTDQLQSEVRNYNARIPRNFYDFINLLKFDKKGELKVTFNEILKK